MSIFDFAMQMEEDGERYYRDLAAQTENPGLKRIFTKLAEDEADHYSIFRNLRDHTPLDVPHSTIMEDARSIFTDMKTQGEVQVDDPSRQKEAYSIALEMEQKSISLYEDKAKETKDPDEVKLLLAIAREERRHYRLLEGILEFISRPDQWLEDAEFVNMTEY